MSGDMPMPMPMPMPMTPPSMDMDMNMMAMTFYWGRYAVVLFKDWPGDSLGMYIVALFFVFFLAFVAEIFSLFQAAKPSRLGGVVAQTGVYALKIGLAYLVMLAVMSFNVGIFIAAVVGHALGFLVVKFRAMYVASKAELPLASQPEPRAAETV